MTDQSIAEKAVQPRPSNRARKFAEDAIRYAWATPHFGLGEISAGYRDDNPVVRLAAAFEHADDLRAASAAFLRECDAGHVTVETDKALRRSLGLDPAL